MMENTPQVIMEQFYDAFSRRNPADMNCFYTNNIYFSDPIFGLLDGDKVKEMWKFMCANTLELSLLHRNFSDRGDHYFTYEWVANYRFLPTGKKVLLKAKAYMKIENGEIIEHSDAYSFYKWVRQAYGIPGWLLGWSSVFKKRVRKKMLKQIGISF